VRFAVYGKRRHLQLQLSWGFLWSFLTEKSLYKITAILAESPPWLMAAGRPIYSLSPCQEKVVE